MTWRDYLNEKLCLWLCGDRIWNRDMSLENDALRVQVEHMRERIKELEDK